MGAAGFGIFPRTFETDFICGVELPALWMIVTEAIYNLRESHNCPRTFDTYFSYSFSQSTWGTSQNLIFKTLRQIGHSTLYNMTLHAPQINKRICSFLWAAFSTIHSKCSSRTSTVPPHFYVICTPRIIIGVRTLCPQHRMSHLLEDLGWVDFDFGVPPCCLAA